MIQAVSFSCTCTGLYVPGSGFFSNTDSRCGLPQATCDCSMWTAHGNVSLARGNLQGNRARPLRRQTRLSSVAYTSICKATDRSNLITHGIVARLVSARRVGSWGRIRGRAPRRCHRLQYQSPPVSVSVRTNSFSTHWSIPARHHAAPNERH